MRSTRDFLLGFLTGIAAGILTAPKTGRESRQWIQDEANKRTQDLQDQWGKGVEQVKTQVDQVKSQVNDWTTKVQDQVSQLNNQSAQKKEEYKDQYNNQVDNLANKAEQGVESTRQSIKLD